MQARSVLKRAPISAQKVRLVLDQIRGVKVEKALNILSFSTKKAAAMTLKLLNSAVSNAENNHNMDIDTLFVSKTFADESSTLKRTMPRAKGRADRILKRTSNITIEVMEKTGDKS